MKKFTEVMKALSDPNRVSIIKMLQHRSMCVCELQEGLGISQPTVSKQKRRYLQEVISFAFNISPYGDSSIHTRSSATGEALES